MKQHTSEWFCIQGKIETALFVRRVNRFLVELKLKDKKVVYAHLHDSGRLRELLIPGTNVIAERRTRTAGRKTAYTLYFAEREGALYTVNSSLPEKVFELYLKNRTKGSEVVREVRAKNSRFDFGIYRSGMFTEFIEVKGVNLKKGDFFLFPDAPTLRGRKHVREMSLMVNEGLRCRLVFIAGSPVAEKIGLNRETDPLFAEEVKRAVRAGVDVEGYAVEINLPCVRVARRIPVVIDG